MSEESKKYVRTIEDVQKVISYAKINEESLLPATQAIYFAEDLKPYKLLELNKDVLSEIECGRSVAFRGEKDDKAVLCTDSRTYEVKEAETSNSLLLFSNLQFPDELRREYNEDKSVVQKEITNVFHTYFELKLCKPGIKKLKRYLEESSYRGTELESELIESGANMYSFDQLLDRIQASRQELLNLLKQVEAFELNGKWRILEFNYHFRVLSYFLNLIDEQSWSHDQIPRIETIRILEELMPQFILEYLFSKYTEESDKRTQEGELLFKLNENKVCQFLGEALLKTTGKFGLSDFLKMWQDSVPEGLMTSLSQLNGLAIIDGSSIPKAIFHYPENELSEDVGERMHQLFASKEKWTMEEIQPYIEPLATDKTDMNTILLKYTRASVSNGVKMYSSRHGKDLAVKVIDDVIKDFANRHQERLHNHVNVEAIQLLDTELDLHRLKRTKPPNFSCNKPVIRNKYSI